MLAKRILATLLPLTLAGCLSASPSGQKVRVTANPDTVRGCEFLGNVKAHSGWGGPAGSGAAASNIEATMQNRTAELGGNVLFVVRNEGSHGSGEAYRCPAAAPTPR